MPHLSPLRWTALALAGVAFVLAVVVQVVPFAGFSTSFFGATADADAYAWEAKFHAEGFGEQSSDSKGWFNDDFDDEGGIGMVRAAAPLLAAAAAAALASALLFLAGPRPGAIAGFLCSILFAVGIYLMANGVKDLFDDQQEWSVGFWFAILAAVLALVAGILGLLAKGSPPEPAPAGAPT